jgi:hypothetical protein
MFSYRVKVHTAVEHLPTDPETDERGHTSLWGGPDINDDNTEPLLLIVRVDDIGEEIGLYTVSKTGSGTPNPIGKLAPASVFSLSLKGIRHVYARCTDAKRDCLVNCTLLVPG